jgi:ABC-type nitrate/sulfonate/bicarbonate transport system substrate-binding protein
MGLPNSFAQEAPPETTTVRLAKVAGICVAPQYIADELLCAEGFTDIRHVLTEPGASSALALARGEIDFTTNFSPPLIIAIEAGQPSTIVAGEHIGCFEVFAREGIRSVPDLKGKTVGVQGLGRASTRSSAAWLRMLDWIRQRTFVGSRVPRPSQWNYSPRERSMRFSACRPSRRNYAPATSVA